MSTLVDKRNHNFTLIENEVITDLKLTPYEGWLYVVLLSHVNRETGVAFPGTGRLAELSGMSETTVKNVIRSLVNLGLIIKTNRFNGKEYASNEYAFVSVKGPSPRAPGGSPDAVPLGRQTTHPPSPRALPGSPDAQEPESLTRVFNQRESNQSRRVQGHTASPTEENLLKKRLQERRS
jgi:DNA-binding transcriptional MocR family regulator